MCRGSLASTPLWRSFSYMTYTCLVLSCLTQTNGTSNGLVPMLRVFNATARYVDQGGNKRPGAFAIYLEPWHPDIFDFLDLKKNTGKEEQVLVIWLLRNQLIKCWCVKSGTNFTRICPNSNNFLISRVYFLITYWYQGWQITLTMVGFWHVYCICQELHTLKSLELKIWLTVCQNFQNVLTKSLSDRILLVLWPVRMTGWCL